jgi:hypothetical protein
VASHKISNGIGGLNETRYFYKDAVQNNQGRGFQGFKQIISKNITSKLMQNSYFHQVFPYAGKLSWQRSYLSNDESVATLNGDVKDTVGAAPLAQMDYTWASKTGTYGQWVYPSSSQQRTWDLTDEALIATSTKAIAATDVDVYGNISKTTSTVTDGWGSYVTVEEKSFTSDETTWWLSQLDHVLQTKKAVDYSATTTYQPDAAYNTDIKSTNHYAWNTDRPLESVRHDGGDTTTAEPPAGTAWTKTAYSNYDTYGHAKTVTTTASGRTPTTVDTYTWTDNGYFP